MQPTEGLFRFRFVNCGTNWSFQFLRRESIELAFNRINTGASPITHIYTVDKGSTPVKGKRNKFARVPHATFPHPINMRFMLHVAIGS